MDFIRVSWYLSCTDGSKEDDGGGQEEEDDWEDGGQGGGRGEVDPAHGLLPGQEGVPEHGQGEACVEAGQQEAGEQDAGGGLEQWHHDDIH